MNSQELQLSKSREPINKYDQYSNMSDPKLSFKKPREFLESLLIENNEKVIKDQYSIHKSIVPTKIQNEIEEQSSSVQSLINAIRNAQTKNKLISEENERLKHEVSNLQTQLEFKENISNEIQIQLSQYDNHKHELLIKIQTLSKNNELMESLLKLSEKEKNKHLEQSAIEKDELHGKIKNLTSELENAKKLFVDISKENKKLREEVSKSKEVILNYENSVVKKLKEEIFELKEIMNIKNEEFKRNIEDINEKNDKEKESLYKKLYAMQEIISSLSFQENNLKRHLDKQVRDIKNDIPINKTTINTFLNKTGSTLKNNNSKGLKNKIFTNKNYTGNEAKSLFKYLIRSKSLDKHSFLDRQKKQKTNDSSRGDMKMTSPHRSKGSETISTFNEKRETLGGNNNK